MPDEPVDAPVIEEDRPHVDHHVEEAAEPSFINDKFGSLVAEAARRAKGVERLDFGSIIDLVVNLLGLLGNCPFARGAKAVKDGDSSFYAGAFNAARQSGFTPKEAVRFAIELQALSRGAEQSAVDEVLEAAPAFGRRAVIALVLATLCILPARAAAQSGPFGKAVAIGQPPAPKIDTRDAEIDNMKRTIDALRKDLNIALNMNEDLKNDVNALRYELKARVPKSSDSPAWSKNEGVAWTPPTPTGSTPGRPLFHGMINGGNGWNYEAEELGGGRWRIWNGAQWIGFTAGNDGRLYPDGTSPAPARQSVVPATSFQIQRPTQVAAARRG